MSNYNEDKFRACFILAGLEYTDIFPIQNGYCSHSCCVNIPWFLFKTKYGLIKIGWRKRVINIDWSDTSLRSTEIAPEKDLVTCWEAGVHAWGWAKVVEYLTNLRSKLERSDSENATHEFSKRQTN